VTDRPTDRPDWIRDRLGIPPRLFWWVVLETIAAVATILVSVDQMVVYGGF